MTTNRPPSPRRLWGGFLLLVLALLATAGCSASGSRVLVPRAELERKLGERFPIEVGVPGAKFVVSDPTLVLLPETNRLRIGVQTRASALGIALPAGQGFIEAALRYERQGGQLFLDHADVDIDAPGISQIPGIGRDAIRQALGIVARETLARQPIYTLKPSSMREGLARRIIKEVNVEREGLVVNLGL